MATPSYMKAAHAVIHGRRDSFCQSMRSKRLSPPPTSGPSPRGSGSVEIRSRPGCACGGLVDEAGVPVEGAVVLLRARARTGPGRGSPAGART